MNKTPTELIQERLPEYPARYNFFEDFKNHLLQQGVPKKYVEKVAAYCWETGHANGYYEVFNVSWDLIEIFK